MRELGEEKARSACTTILRGDDARPNCKLQLVAGRVDPTIDSNWRQLGTGAGDGRDFGRPMPSPNAFGFKPFLRHFRLTSPRSLKSVNVIQFTVIGLQIFPLERNKSSNCPHILRYIIINERIARKGKKRKGRKERKSSSIKRLVYE